MAGAADKTGNPAGAADRRPLLLRATEAHRAGDRDTALRLYTALLAREPRHALAWTNLGALFRAGARHGLALAAQRRAQALNPDVVTVRTNLANILDDTGAHAEAAELRRGLLAERPDDADQAALLVRSLRACGDIAAALDAARAAVARFLGDNGRNPRTLVELERRGYIRFVPRHPDGADYDYEPRSGRVSGPSGRVLGESG